MKKLFLTFLMTIFILTACGGETQPAANPTEEPVTTSQTESSPEPTELVEVQLEPQAGDTRTYVDGSTIVYIPAGEFTMGVKDGVDNPEHMVSTDAFWIYATEVSNIRYGLCVSAGVCSSPNVALNLNFGVTEWDNMPVTGVNYEQAKTYCEWVHGRLPTEAEWEKTARGTDARVYPWGNDDLTCDRANYKDCNEGLGGVTSKPDGKTPLGVWSMTGNVFEWIFDWYASDYYPNSPSDNPAGPETGETRVIRGGSLLSEIADLSAYQRFSEIAERSRNDLGFRCVVEDENVDDFAPMCQGALIVKSGTAADVTCETDLAVGKPYCNNGVPTVDVTITYSENQQIWYGTFFSEKPADCTWDGGTLPIEGHTCTAPELSSFTVGVSNYCAIEAPTCAEGYTLDPDLDSCVYSGEQKDVSGCLEGYEYDSAVGCCTATANLAYPISCDAYFINKNDNTKLCTLDGLGMDSVKVSMPSCTIKDKPDEEEPEPEPEPTQPPICIPNPATGGGCP